MASAPLERLAASLKPLRAPLTQPRSFSREHGYPAPSPSNRTSWEWGPRPWVCKVQGSHVLLELGPPALGSDEDQLHKVVNLVCVSSSVP